MSLNVGVVGATGMVGEEFLQLLEQRNFPLKNLKLFASPESAGKKVRCVGQEWTLEVLQPGCFSGLQLVFFSSGDEISREWGPQAVASGAFAIDNSAAFRMDPEISLVVPEINGDLLPESTSPALIANPNCSTIQLVLALSPLHQDFGVSQVKVATYQAVSGAGKAAKEELLNQLDAHIQGAPSPSPSLFPHPIAFNCLPQIGSFGDDGFCSEEIKIMKESQKILRDQDLKVSAFTVRVPVLNGHSEAAWVTLKKKVELPDILRSLSAMPAVQVMDQPRNGIYPTASKASGNDPVFVGRIHPDRQDPLTWLMWIVADNLRVGAALNGIRIAEKIYRIH